MGRRGEVVQDEKATGSKQLDDTLGVVTLASAVAPAHLRNAALLEPAPKARSSACPDPANLPGRTPLSEESAGPPGGRGPVDG
ncbi:hypothetical protein SUDANB108_06780 [Streptomyces sp. enrichment culture]